MKEIIEKLTINNKTIATMESCTGGKIVNELTNIKGSSNVVLFSCVTYSTEYKIKMGVSKQLIDKHTVYSQEVAQDMAYKITLFANSDYGIGVTGNLTNEFDIVYISIYSKENNHYSNLTFSTDTSDRNENKKVISNLIEKILKDIV